MRMLTKEWGDGSPSPATIALSLLALAPIVAYALFVGYLQRDLPIYDDYIIQLELAQLKAASQLSDKLSILFRQLNEHRLAYTRFWFWLVHQLNGTISYSALIVIGNLPLLGIWGVFGGLLYRLRVPLVALVPLSWLLFQFQFNSNSLWAMASLQNITIHFLYPLLFVLLLNRNRTAWIASWVVAMLLCYTSGNGFLALVLAGVSLAYQRRWQDMVGWAILSAGLGLLYFWSYQRPANFPTADTSTLIDKVLATLIFLGMHLEAYPQSGSFGAHVINGLIICGPVLLLTGWSCWHLAMRWRSRQPLTSRDGVLLVAVLISGFIISSAVAAVQSRINFMGWIGLTESRYRLYSTMLVLTGYVQLVAFASRRGWYVHRLGWVSVGLSMLVWAGIYNQKISESYLFRSQALAYYHNWTQLQPDTTKAFIATVFRPSGQDAAALERIQQRVSLAAHTYPQHPRVIQSLTEEDDSYVIASANEPNSQSPNEWNMLIFWASDHFLLFPVMRQPNRNWRSFWLTQTWFGSGFQSRTIKWTLKKVSYRLGFLKSRADSLTVYRTAHVVRP